MIANGDGKAFIKSINKIWGASATAFITDAKDRILANSQENIKRALEKLKVEVSYDTFSEKPILKWEKYHGVMQDSVVNHIWLTIDRSFHFRPAKEFFYDVVQDLAHQNSFHPVIDYFNTLAPWDGTPRLDRWLIDYAHAADTSYVRAISALVLIAAVRRVRRPGCKFDEMLVLESGEQGLFKSTALRTLCPREEWFSDDLPLNVEAKQIVERTLGKWIIEVSELAGFHKSQIEHLKGMLSRQVDGPVRLAYARLAIERPRQFVQIGTTNNYNYLSDGTGNRRFWPVRVGKFNVSALAANRDQLWAEACQREANNESIRLAPELYPLAALQQERRRTLDPWEEKLAQIFDGPTYRLTPDEIWEALGVATERRTEQFAKRVSTILQILGFRRIAVKEPKTGKVIRGWGKGSGQRDPYIIGLRPGDQQDEE